MDDKDISTELQEKRKLDRDFKVEIAGVILIMLGFFTTILYSSSIMNGLDTGELVNCLLFYK